MMDWIMEDEWIDVLEEVVEPQTPQTPSRQVQYTPTRRKRSLFTPVSTGSSRKRVCTPGRSRKTPNTNKQRIVDRIVASDYEGTLRLFRESAVGRRSLNNFLFCAASTQACVWLAIPAIITVSLRVLKYVTRCVFEVTRYVIHVTRNLNYVTRFLS